MNKRYLLMPVALLLALPVAAQKKPAESESPWTGKAGLGFLATSGNTENTSLNALFEVGYATGNWAHKFATSAVHSSQDDLTTTEAYKAGWNTRYSFSEHDYVFGRLDYLKDRFAGYQEQFSQTAGYGRRVIDSDDHTLDMEIGAGAKQLKAEDGTSESDLIVRGGLDYKWAFSENAEFTQALTIESGETNTLTESRSAVSAKLFGDLALVASFTVRNNSDVPPPPTPDMPFEKTDTFTALSLEYVF